MEESIKFLKESFLKSDIVRAKAINAAYLTIAEYRKGNDQSAKEYLEITTDHRHRKKETGYAGNGGGPDFCKRDFQNYCEPLLPPRWMVAEILFKNLWMVPNAGLVPGKGLQRIDTIPIKALGDSCPGAFLISGFEVDTVSVCTYNVAILEV